MTAILERWRNALFSEFIKNEGGGAPRYLSLFLCEMATTAINYHICPTKDVGPWPATIDEKRKALADGINAAIRELEAIKTAFNLEGEHGKE